MVVMGRLNYNAGYIKKNKRGDEGNQGKREEKKAEKQHGELVRSLSFQETR
jgi:hypothetical protein